MDPDEEERKKEEEEEQERLKQEKVREQNTNASFSDKIKENEKGNDTDKESYEHLFLPKMTNILINIQTNIPNGKVFPITSSFLIQTDDPSEKEQNKEKMEQYPLSEFPFFTTEIKYPKDLIQKIPRKDILFFFFNKSFFKKNFMKLISMDEIKKIINSKAPKNKYRAKEEETVNGEFNIQIMLKMLFTVVFPQKADISSSLDKFIKKDGSSVALLPQDYDYTFVSVGGQPYTITRVVWLNDLFNHPLYGKVCSNFITFKRWCDTEIKRSESKSGDLLENIMKILRKQNFEKDIRYVNNILSPKTGNVTRISQKDILNLNTILRTIRKLDAYVKIRDPAKFIKATQEIDNEFIFSNEVETQIEFQIPVGDLPPLRKDSDKDFWYSGFLEADPTNKNNFKIIIYMSPDKTVKLMELSVEQRFLINYNIREPPKIDKILRKLENEKKNKDYYDSLVANDFKVEYITKASSAVYTNDINSFINNGWANISPPRRVNGKNTIFPFTDMSIEANVDNFLKLFNDNVFVSRYKNFPDDDTDSSDTKKNPLDIVLSIITNLDEVISASYIDNESLKIYKKLIEISKELKKLRKFSKDYLKNKSIDIKKKDDFKSYEDADILIKSIEEILEPNRESTNQILQRMFINYSKNIQSGITFNSLMDLLEPCFNTFNCKPIENLRDSDFLLPYLNTSFHNINSNNFKKPQYEIYIHIDLVKGKLDTTNIGKIKCEYKDVSLTDQFNSLFRKKRVRNWILTNHPFLDVSKASTAAPAKKQAGRGGKKRSRKIKKFNLHKTIKLR